MAALLETRDVTIRFGGLVAVNLLNISVDKGDIVAIIGPNGAGKTTAFNLITGVYTPTEGDILLRGEKINGKRPDEIAKINKILCDSHADMLFVGMGVPKQDIFIYENMNIYQIPLSFSIGAAIDFLAGNVKRAPKWMSNHGLEWFYRFLQEPKRMFKRYFIDDLKIFRLAWKYR